MFPVSTGWHAYGEEATAACLSSELKLESAVKRLHSLPVGHTVPTSLQTDMHPFCDISQKCTLNVYWIT
jgi:hypothetical protein